MKTERSGETKPRPKREWQAMALTKVGLFSELMLGSMTMMNDPGAGMQT